MTRRTTRILASLLATALLTAGCSKSEPSDAPAAEAPAAQKAAEKTAEKAPTPAKTAEAAAEHAGAAAFDKAMAGVVQPYLKIQDALARDTTEGVAEAAKAIGAAAAKLEPGKVTGEHAGHYTDVPAKLGEGATALAGAADLAAAREAFKGLSKPMGMWATMAKPDGIDLVYCPMAKGSWLQKTGDIRNPYHGSEMLACGEVVSGPGKKGGE